MMIESVFKSQLSSIRSAYKAAWSIRVAINVAELNDDEPKLWRALKNAENALSDGLREWRKTNNPNGGQTNASYNLIDDIYDVQLKIDAAIAEYKASGKDPSANDVTLLTALMEASEMLRRGIIKLEDE